ncbi:MAG: outer membrane protein assembly factor BamE [Rhodocyclaceae bacterium]|nr:outer membrane protein assembly factor BamE [Rhodocyclaceae bacterium]MBX3669132.1 outer membrane protein assembly factor BamE [Rhodocyclaceae bacterium]
MNGHCGKVVFTVLLAALLAGCAVFQNIQPGRDTGADIRTRFGPPAMEWQEADGATNLVYPFGPNGLETWMVKLDASGRVAAVEQVLQMSTGFKRIQPGMNREQVTRVLGPHFYETDFARRAEIVWDYRYRDDWLQIGRFHVVFDAQGVVKQTLTTREFLNPGRGF